MRVLDHSTYQLFTFFGSLPLFVGRVFQPLEKEWTYEATDNSDSTAYQDWEQHVPQLVSLLNILTRAASRLGSSLGPHLRDISNYAIAQRSADNGVMGSA
jgi:hypothetical protein